MKRKFQQSIAFKVNMLVLLCISLVMLMLGCISYLEEKHKLEGDIDRTVTQLAKRLSDYLGEPVFEFNDRLVHSILVMEMESPHVRAIIFKDAQREHFKIEKMKTKLGEIVDLSPDIDFAEAGWKVTTADVFFYGQVIGKILIYTTTHGLNQLLWKILALFLLLSLTLSTVLLLALKKLIVRPLANIDKAVQQLTLGDTITPISVIQYDELGRLASSFNRMATIIADHKRELEDKIEERTRELAEANQARSRFFANLSHEFRAPLTLILGPIEALIAGKYGNQIDREHHIFRSVLHHGSHLLRVVNNILDAAKIEAGRMTPSLRSTKIAEQIQRYVTAIEPAVEHRGLRILFDNNSNGFSALVDPGLFEKAIFNLLFNAMKFTPKGGHILVRLEATEEYFTVAVKDTGLGMTEEEQKQLFERFRQLRNSKFQADEGTGLGLALTKEIVELHGGTIHVESEAGRGSVFTLRFPLGSEAGSGAEDDADPSEVVLSRYPSYCMSAGLAARVSEEPVLPEAEDRQTILLVDDSSEMLEFLRSLLEEKYQVIEALDGKMGLEKTLRENPDLILSDIMMPEMDGGDMLKEIRTHEKCRSIPILLLTARADESLRLQGFQAGATDYIMKPFNPWELQARICTHMEMKRLRDISENQRNALAQRTRELEETLRQIALERNRFHGMADELPSVMLEIDLEDRILYLNRAGKTFFQCVSSESMQGELFTAYMHPHDKAKFHRMIFSETQQTLPYQEFRFILQGGQEHVVLLTFSPIEHQGQISGARIVMIEIQGALNLLIMPDDEFYMRYGFTPREREVCCLVLKGFRNKDIARQLCISDVTVKKHVSNILGKTGSPQRSALIEFVRKAGTAS